MRLVIATLLGVALPTSWAWALTSTTVSFQRDVNGYTDVAEMRISFDYNSTAIPINSDNMRDGNDGLTTTTYYLIDSFQADDPVTPAVEDSNDEQELIKFGSILGSGAGQIPLGATILDAQMTYKTYDTGTTPPSPGAWGVAALNQPFTAATRYTDFPSSNPNPLLPYRGAWFEDGADQAIGHPYATRAVGAFAGPQSAGPPPTGTNNLGGVTNADVFAIVQRWADDPTGSNNYGMVVQGGFTGQTNGWGFFTSGSPTIENRPKLSVTYTTSPIGKKTFQRDLNGYNGDTMARLDSGADLAGAGDDVTLDGSTLTGAYYVDGATSTGGILLDLVKFTNVFGAGANQSPADKPVAKAWLVLTTGLNDDNRSPGPFEVHRMLRDWTVTSTYTGFGATAGLQEADGDIGPAVDTNYGAINGGESWFDITSYLEAVRTGAQDYGLAVLPGTTDGWAIMMNGATDTTIRPRLVVYSDLTTTPAGVLGDYNNNGVVDAADYVLWRNGGPLLNEGDAPGTVNTADYTYWRSRYGATTGSGAGLGGGAVPEPATWLIGMITTLLFVSTSRGRKV